MIIHHAHHYTACGFFYILYTPLSIRTPQRHFQCTPQLLCNQPLLYILIRSLPVHCQEGYLSIRLHIHTVLPSLLPYELIQTTTTRRVERFFFIGDYIDFHDSSRQQYRPLMQTIIHFKTYTWSSICSNQSENHSHGCPFRGEGGADHLTHWNSKNCLNFYKNCIPFCINCMHINKNCVRLYNKKMCVLLQKVCILIIF